MSNTDHTAARFVFSPQTIALLRALPKQVRSRNLGRPAAGMTAAAFEKYFATEETDLAFLSNPELFFDTLRTFLVYLVERKIPAYDAGDIEPQRAEREQLPDESLQVALSLSTTLKARLETIDFEARTETMAAMLEIAATLYWMGRDAGESLTGSVNPARVVEAQMFLYALTSYLYGAVEGIEVALESSVYGRENDSEGEEDAPDPDSDSGDGPVAAGVDDVGEEQADEEG